MINDPNNLGSIYASIAKMTRIVEAQSKIANLAAVAAPPSVVDMVKHQQRIIGPISESLAPIIKMHQEIGSSLPRITGVLSHLNNQNSVVAQRLNAISVNPSILDTHETALHIRNTYAPILNSVNALHSKLSPLILQRSEYASMAKSFVTAHNPVFENLRAISNYRNFERLKNIHDQFGGDFNPKDFSEKDLQKAVVSRSDVIEDVSRLIKDHETKGFNPNYINEVIYQFIVEKVKLTNRETYLILFSLFSVAASIFSNISNYQMGETIENEILPSVKSTEKHLIDLHNSNHTSVESLEGRLESFEDESISNQEELKNSVEVWMRDLHEQQMANDRKMDSLIDEFRVRESSKDNDTLSKDS